MVFQVKEMSLNEFLKKNLVDYPTRDREQVSPYHLLKDILYFKKGFDVEIGKLLEIELLDSGRVSGKGIRNTYQYSISDYDSVSLKADLITFHVEATDENSKANYSY